MSNREKKRAVAAGARALRAKPGWDPAKFRADSATERLRQGIEERQVNAVLAEAEACEACRSARSEQDDPSALCLAHLRKAMGL